MENNFTDDLYEILDEMNARIEEIVNGYNDPEVLEIIITQLNQKSLEFIEDFQQEVEKFELIEIEK